MKLILALFAIALLLAVLSRVRRSRNRAIATARVVPIGILIFAGVLLAWGAATVGIERIFGISSDSVCDLYLNLFGWSLALVLSFAWMIRDYRRTTSVEQPDEPNGASPRRLS
jgi:formate hydrogenlyase subunit 3/multisubunit Na+/H+ antiporter MnhD subunit